MKKNFLFIFPLVLVLSSCSLFNKKDGETDKNKQNEKKDPLTTQIISFSGTSKTEEEFLSASPTYETYSGIDKNYNFCKVTNVETVVLDQKQTYETAQYYYQKYVMSGTTSWYWNSVSDPNFYDTSSKLLYSTPESFVRSNFLKESKAKENAKYFANDNGLYATTTYTNIVISNTSEVHYKFEVKWNKFGDVEECLQYELQKTTSNGITVKLETIYHYKFAYSNNSDYPLE